MTGPILIYGASGYTGKLIAQRAAEGGLRPILAGRSLAKVLAVAKPLGFEARAFGLADPKAIDTGLEGVAAVLCAAGPFSATSRPMVDACLRNRVHYLDITGEIDVFEAIAARNGEARARNVTLLPGVGFDVVPSDCLAAHLKRRLPDATELKLSLSVGASVSRGTAKTMVEGIDAGTKIRRNGIIVRRERAETGSCDFGSGERPTIQISWGDVSTAFHSTGIPDIEVQFEAPAALRAFAQAPAIVKSVLGLPAVQGFLKGRIDRMPEGPSAEARRTGRTVLVGEAGNRRGERVRTRLVTPEGYALTALTALDAARRVAGGEVGSGFKTPSLAFGPDYVLGFEGVIRQDLNR